MAFLYHIFSPLQFRHRNSIISFMISMKAEEALPTQSKDRIKISTSLFLASILVLSLMASFTLPREDLIQSPRSLTENQEIQVKRKQYFRIAAALIRSNAQLEDLDLALSNFAYGDSSDADLQQREVEQLTKLTDAYRFDRFKSQLPFCIIVQKLPLSNTFAFELSLNSIFNQNYSNYKVVILHEPSESDGFQTVKNYLQGHKISNKTVINSLNRDHQGILKNIHDASHKHCGPASISLNLVGGSQLLGRNVLRVFNTLYQVNPVALVYSNIYRYSQGNFVKVGFNAKFHENQLQNIRKLPFHMAGAVTYRTDFLLGIPEKDFQGRNSLDEVYEQALFFPLVERMGGVVLKIDGFLMMVNEIDSNYGQFLQRVRSRKNASEEVRSREAHSRNQTYYKQAKNSFFITSFSRKYLTTNPELSNISTSTRQKTGPAKPFNSTPAFTLLPDESSTRRGDRYIYSSQMVIAQEKWRFEQACLSNIESVRPRQSNRMIKYSLQLGSDIDGHQRKLQREYFKIAKNTLKLWRYKLELPFCIVMAEMPSSNEYFRFEHLLNSVFAQDYSNYFVVINNRNPMLDKLIRKYLHYYQIDRQKYVYRFNEDYKSTSLQAVHESIHKHCSPQSIAFVLRGWEELLLRNALKVFNAQYSRKNEQIIYSPTCFYDHRGKVKYGFIDPPEFTLQEFRQNKFREAEKRFDFFITFKAKLFMGIKEKDLKDSHGHFYASNLEEAIYLPLFELSCLHSRKIAGAYHFRNRDLEQGSRYRESVKEQMKKKPKYPCFGAQKTAKKP